LGDNTLISFIWPKQNEDLVKQLQEQKSTVFAMDCIPRTLSRGQTYGKTLCTHKQNELNMSCTEGSLSKALSPLFSVNDLTG